MEANVNNKLYRNVISFCKILYIFIICIYAVYLFTAIVKINVQGVSNKNISDVLDNMLFLIRSGLIYFSFSQLLLAYDTWVSTKKGSALLFSILTKLANVLYVIAVLDAAMIISKYLFNVEIKPVAKNLADGGYAIAPFISFIEKNTNMISEITNYLTPRPFGGFAFLIALFISHFINLSKQKAA